MNVSIIGSGYVGLTTGACLAELGHEVRCVDNDAGKIKVLGTGKPPFFEPGLEDLIAKNRSRLRFTTDLTGSVSSSDVVFICVGTPTLPEGNSDLSDVEKVAMEIGKSLNPNHYTVVAQKSTVPVNTGEQVERTIQRAIAGLEQRPEFGIAANPEFLREGSAVHDFMNPDRIVVGYSDPRIEGIMRRLYKPLTASPTNAPLVLTDVRSAELIKHSSNAFLAMKISFINATAELCEAAGADIGLVAKGVGLDSRIGPSFLRPGIGYGGSCFPKDARALGYVAAQFGCHNPLIAATEEINRRQRDRFVDRIRREMWMLSGKQFGVWGLAFKPETDDMREAPSTDIVRRIVDENGSVAVYDPQAMNNARAIFERLGMRQGVRFAADRYDAAKGADALLILTEWDQFRFRDDEAGLARVRDSMVQPIIFDGRNIFEPARMQELGFDYHSIGRASVHRK